MSACDNYEICSTNIRDEIVLLLVHVIPYTDDQILHNSIYRGPSNILFSIVYFFLFLVYNSHTCRLLTTTKFVIPCV